MGTHANIVIKDEKGNRALLYKHYDGYPGILAGVIEEAYYELVASDPQPYSVETIANYLQGRCNDVSIEKDFTHLCSTVVELLVLVDRWNVTFRTVDDRRAWSADPGNDMYLVYTGFMIFRDNVAV